MLTIPEGSKKTYQKNCVVFRSARSTTLPVIEEQQEQQGVLHHDVSFSNRLGQGRFCGMACSIECKEGWLSWLVLGNARTAANDGRAVRIKEGGWKR